MRRILLLALLAGCSGEIPTAGALIWARSTDSSTLDPAEVEWGEDAKIVQNVFETLVGYKHDSVELEGRLAESWTVSPDGKTVAFKLRKGVTFHDGTPFTSESVVYTFQRLLDPKHPQAPKSIPYAANFAEIAAVAADGPERAVFTLKRPSAVFLYNLTLYGANVVSPAAVKAAGAEWPRKPVGTGPYRLFRWDRDVRIVLDRHDGYWGRKPPVARLIVVPVASPQTAVEKLKKGEVHVVDHVGLGDVKALEAHAATKVDFETSMNVCYLGFNLRRAPYSDPEFRRAVALAMDRKGLNQVAFHGLAEPASNLVPPAIWKEPTEPYEEDLEKAKAIVAKLGVKEVELIHMTFSRPYVPEPLRVAEFVKDRLSRIGLEVRLTGYDKSAYSAKTREEGHPMFLLGWSADIPDTDNFFYAILHGSTAGEMNYSYFQDPAFDEAVSAAQVELDPAKRKALYAKACARYREVLPTVPLVHVRQLIGLSKRVDYDLHPLEYRFGIAGLRE
jgi:peptide/nickel transport system substrate-binding protein